MFDSRCLLKSAPQIGQLARAGDGEGRVEVGEIKAEWTEVKAGLGGAVVINLIRERKGPGAYIVINPHNGRIIFISQFSSLYTIPSSVYCCVSMLSYSLLSSFLSFYLFIYLFWVVILSPIGGPFVFTVQHTYICNTPFLHCIHFELRAHLLQVGLCVLVWWSLKDGVCVWETDWAQPHLETNYNESFDLPVFWQNQFPSVGVIMFSRCVRVCVNTHTYSAFSLFSLFSPLRPTPLTSRLNEPPISMKVHAMYVCLQERLPRAW